MAEPDWGEIYRAMTTLFNDPDISRLEFEALKIARECVFRRIRQKAAPAFSRGGPGEPYGT